MVRSSPTEQCDLQDSIAKCSGNDNVDYCSFILVNDQGQVMSDGRELSAGAIQQPPYTCQCIAECQIRGRRCNITTDVIACSKQAQAGKR